MFMSPRILYGLHERFVLFPYERGSRRSKLVIRAKKLASLCLSGLVARDPIVVGAPLVLGEIADCRIARNQFVPVVVTGLALNALKTAGVDWQLRYHRVRSFAERSIRFESGSKMIYATHTPYFSLELLFELTREGLHEPNPRAGVP